MKVTLRASTGAQIRVWRVDELFHAMAVGPAVEPQICVAVDLFEVIAELAGLNLDVRAESVEAVGLAIEARRQLEDRHDELGDISRAE